ncbi:MAG: right-handed parallel beta-helix repeat-containing protein [Bacteroidia bacterium]
MGIISNSDRDDSIHIQSNRIEGGSYGIQLYGGGTNTSDQENSLIIEGNHISNVYSVGIYLAYQNAPIIRNNVIDLGNNSSTYGIYLYYVYDDARITKTKSVQTIKIHMEFMLTILMQAIQAKL